MPANPPIDIDLSELCRLANVTPRTVRYYIQQGLLPAASSRGPRARYGQGHLDRLRLIGLLRADDLPLSRIRETLEGLDDDEVAAMLQEASKDQPEAGDSALDYIRSVRTRSHPLLQSRVAMPSVTDDLHSQKGWVARGPQVGEPGKWRSQWERIVITPDVELHVRRPLSRTTARAVDRLTQAARDLFKGEAP